MSFCYKHARPAVTVDAVVFGLDETELKVLLIRRAKAPCKGLWAIPGGFIQMDESAEEAVQRKLCEETGIGDLFLEQLYTFSEVDRDPRERVISIAYFALVRPDHLQIRAHGESGDVSWFSLKELPELAFDHAKILEVARTRLRNKIRYQPVGFELLPTSFTMGEIWKLYENALERPIDKRNFMRKIKKLEVLREIAGQRREGAHRPAALYSFDEGKYRELQDRGIDFEL